MTVQVAADPLSGTKVGDYVIDAPIGIGGMGIVYRAVHPLIGRRVAVKVLRPEMASDPEQTARFLKEAQALSAVKHRGIIDVISFGNLPDRRQYMVMEFLEGEALDEVLQRERRLSPVRALAVVDEVLDALSAAHKAGVVHRDIKPSNVFLLEQSNGTRVVKVVDFGLARIASPAALQRTSERSSLMAGTPEYLAPEQAKGLAATPATDLYAVGVMLFELLTGRLPFEEQGVIPLLDAHVKKPPPRVSSLVDTVPPSLDELVDALLAKAPEDRPGSADVVRSTIQRVLRELRNQETQVAVAPVSPRRSAPRPATTQPSSPPPPAAAPTTRIDVPRRAPLAAIAAGVAGVVALASVGAWLASRAPAEPILAPSPPPVPVVEPGSEPPPAAVVEAPPPAATDPDELAPLPGVTPKPRPKPKPTAAPLPKVCEGDWRRTLRTELGKVEQEARRDGKLVGEAEPRLGDIYAGIRAEKADCPQLAARLEQWRNKFLR